MNVLGGLLVFVGLCLGLATVMISDGGLTCITSIATMLGGALLLQAAQRRIAAEPLGEQLTAE